MALFKLGNVVATPAALATCENSSTVPYTLLQRHCGGDFGELCAEDVAANILAIQHDERILSSYRVNGVKLYVITEWDRSVTTLLCADEY
jgi:hypothetical protein